MKGIKEVTLRESQHLVELIDSGLISYYGSAIDGGAHAGAWTVIMAKHFKMVHAFEPHPRAFAYLAENCAGLDNVELHNVALMDKNCAIDVYAPGRTTLTATQVRYNKEGQSKAISIDSLNLPSCGFLKLDVEGAEHKALQGAVITIEKYRPFILVEMNNLGKRFGIRDGDTAKLIKSMGYKEVWARGVDRGYVHV